MGTRVVLCRVAQKGDPGLRVLGDAEVLQAGYGYWVRVEADTIWTITHE